MITTWIQAVYQFLWGDLFFRIPLPGGSSFGVSLLIILLIPTGIYFTIRTRFCRFVFWRYGSRAYREKEGRWQSVDFSDTDRLNCNKSRNGKSGWE